MGTELGRGLGRGAGADTEKQQTGASLSFAGGRAGRSKGSTRVLRVSLCRSEQGPGVAGREQDARSGYTGSTTETAEHPSGGTRCSAEPLCSRQKDGGPDSRDPGMERIV